MVYRKPLYVWLNDRFELTAAKRAAVLRKHDLKLNEPISEKIIRNILNNGDRRLRNKLQAINYHTYFDNSDDILPDNITILLLRHLFGVYNDKKATVKEIIENEIGPLDDAIHEKYKKNIKKNLIGVMNRFRIILLCWV